MIKDINFKGFLLLICVFLFLIKRKMIAETIFDKIIRKEIPAKICYEDEEVFIIPPFIVSEIPFNRLWLSTILTRKPRFI